MKRVPKISIVTPSYNQAPFIGATIESVLAQAGAFEIEYIVMDGGSTDGSVDVIRAYADRVAAGAWPVQCAGVSMAWVSQRDNGQSDAINQGLRRATGDILSYLNSDDMYAPGAFEWVARAFAEQVDVDIIYGDGDVIDADGNVQWEWLSRPYDHAVMSSYHFLWNDFTNYIMQQATFWRRQLHDRIGLFDESFHYAMDAEYWIRAGHMGARLVHIPHKLGKFRLIQGTKSLSSPTIFWADYLEIFRRYRGSRSMGMFFAYFYYNLGRQFDYDIAQAQERGKEAFAQWEALPDHEREMLARQASRGFTRACLLLASDLRSKGMDAQASALFRLGIFRTPLLVLHPFSLRYLLQRASGRQLTPIIDAWGQRAINWYRAHRYQYRYLQRDTRSP
jgi:glycosyltransferase involved in cell wall biosynthesis